MGSNRSKRLILSSLSSGESSVKDRSLYNFEEAGAWMLILKYVLSKTIVSVGKIVPQNKMYRFDTMSSCVSEMSNKLDTMLFAGHPQEASAGVFYGGLRSGYGTGDTTDRKKQTRREVRELVRFHLLELLEETNRERE